MPTYSFPVGPDMSGWVFYVFMLLKTKAVLQTTDKLIAGAQESIFTPDHYMFTELELAANYHVPHIFGPLFQGILNCCPVTIV